MKKKAKKAGAAPGCAQCRKVPSKPEEVAFDRVSILWDRSHSNFELWRCRSCGQGFLKQFHEIVNWHGGDDDVWIRFTPLTDKEEAGLDAISGNWNKLAALMRRRERLVLHPDGGFRWDPDASDAGDLMPPG